MYFLDFNFDSPAVTKSEMRFIAALSAILEQFGLHRDKVEISRKKDKKEGYIDVRILHRTERNYDLHITLNHTGVIIFFSDAHYHFDEQSGDDDWAGEAVGFISQILQGKMEVRTYYKGEKIVRERIYYCREVAEKELVSSSYNFSLALFNPFVKEKERIVTISYL